MEKIRTIRNVDSESWDELRLLATRYKTPLGLLLMRMIKTYKRETEKGWRNILSYKKILTDKEADEMLLKVKSMRSEMGFR